MAYQNKSKMVNGHDKRRVNGSAHAQNGAGESGDIRQHISEISQVLGPHCASKFVPLNGPSRAEQAERIRQHMNFPSPKNIRNLKLYEDDSEDEDNGKRSYDLEEPFDENAVRAGVRSINGGREWSDTFLRERWLKQEYNKAKLPLATEQKEEISSSQTQRDVFARNVGMRSIMQHKKDKKVNASTSRKDEIINPDAENVGAINCKFPFIQDALDPDFVSRQFCGVDNKDDFIVEHVGKVVKVTARQYMIENITDKHFAFSRKNK